ncbi:protein phosphatase 2C domain-containing protein, partial [Escherichia sp. R-CC3]
MSWRLVYASAVGTSHISADLPCQDACQMQVAWLNDQQPLLVMFLADGAGSVSQGGEGATLAVNELLKVTGSILARRKMGIRTFGAEK